jgi:hypothetical protein
LTYRKLARLATALVVGLLLVGWSEPFIGSPAAPQSYTSTGLDIAVHARSMTTRDTFDAMHAQHGPDCAPPPDTHGPIDQPSQAVFLCNDHLMTAINHGEYAAVYLTPDQLLDFSQGEAAVRFDLSTLQTAPRDWVDVWITPFADHLQLPLDAWLPDLKGPPRNAVHLKQKGGYDGWAWDVEVCREFVCTTLDQGRRDLGISHFLTPSATVRTAFELRIARTFLKVSAPGYLDTPSKHGWGVGAWWVDTGIPDLGFDQAVVQFGHHSYVPCKDEPPGSACVPNTWHWDNLTLEPSLPTTRIPADRKFVSAGESVSFASPAPAEAFLRFSAVGLVELSLDGGQTWQAAHRQAESLIRPEIFSSYLHSVPPGTTSAMLRFGPDGAYQGPFRAKDFSLVSQGRPPTRTPLPFTPTPTPTAPPTSTSPPTSTATGVPPPTETPLPTATPIATFPTPTPVSADCLVTVTRDGQVVARWACE